MSTNLILSSKSVGCYKEKSSPRGILNLTILNINLEKLNSNFIFKLRSAEISSLQMQINNAKLSISGVLLLLLDILNLMLLLFTVQCTELLLLFIVYWIPGAVPMLYILRTKLHVLCCCLQYTEYQVQYWCYIYYEQNYRCYAVVYSVLRRVSSMFYRIGSSLFIWEEVQCFIGQEV